MQKIYCDGCGVELEEMFEFCGGGSMRRIIDQEVNGIHNHQDLIFDLNHYDLCVKCKERIKAAVKAEFKAIKEG